MSADSASGPDSAPADDRPPPPGIDVGPLLYLRGYGEGRVQLAALVVRRASGGPPELSVDGEAVPARMLGGRSGWTAWGFDFSLPARADAAYRVDGTAYPVNAALEGDLRLAFLSCNGQEHGDLRRPDEERDAMWARLCRQHEAAPFNLLLHGGDQIYADEMLEATPATREWAKRGWHRRRTGPPDGEVAEALREDLFARYMVLYARPRIAWLMARVPSVAIWDDHDICDGWGSLAAATLDAPIGKAVFAVAREHFLLFQMGTVEGDLPDICLDRSGTSLGWHARLPGLDVVAPDLRSERRPDRVMGTRGWEATRRALAAAQGPQILLLSSVPALGPRLSWLEAALHLTPPMEKYEDDLRDQWQSRAHREEWKDFLRAILYAHEQRGLRVAVLSGEIHLATHGTLDSAAGPVRQLVASGIAHPPPSPAYGRVLGALARLGPAPLPDHPIRMRPLPGRRAVYTSERNYLVLERRGGRWTAVWELEESGPTPPLALD